MAQQNTGILPHITTWCCNPEDHDMNLQSHEDLKSCILHQAQHIIILTAGGTSKLRPLCITTTFLIDSCC